MPKVKKPRAGSLGFVPKKRAKRIYPRMNNYPKKDKISALGFSGYKAGMTSVIILDTKKGSPTQGEEINVPATIIECPSIKIKGIRAYKNTPNGYNAMAEFYKDIGEDKLKCADKIRLLTETQPKMTGVRKKKPEVFEIEVSGKNTEEKIKYCKEMLGKELKISDVFKEGEYIDVLAVTKGKGFQGPMKRFGVKKQNRKNMPNRRHVGTLGPETPRRVLWTVPQAGQMGFFTRTEYNKKILKIGNNGKEITPKSGVTNYGVVETVYLLIEGSIPGPRKRLVMLRSAIRPPKIPVFPTEIKRIMV